MPEKSENSSQGAWIGITVVIVVIAVCLAMFMMFRCRDSSSSPSPVVNAQHLAPQAQVEETVSNTVRPTNRAGTYPNQVQLDPSMKGTNVCNVGFVEPKLNCKKNRVYAKHMQVASNYAPRPVSAQMGCHGGGFVEECNDN